MGSVFDNKTPEREFTSNEISMMLNIPSGSLTTLKRKLNIEVKTVAFEKGRKCVWTYSQYLLLKEYQVKLEEKRKRLNKVRSNRSETNQICLKRSSLVTDERFFDLSYFPDVVPQQFKDNNFYN